MRKVIFLLAVSIFSLAAIACGSEPSDVAATDSQASSSVPTVDAADFSVPVVRNVDGDIQPSTFSLAANRGKSTVLYFSFAG